ncbi:MAG: hypothetical protein HKN15_11330 [Xanthomonadales bacterium]|nr:hypothetical protein [Xanthomonadales bacterium]
MLTIFFTLLAGTGLLITFFLALVNTGSDLEAIKPVIRPRRSKRPVGARRISHNTQNKTPWGW